MRSRQCPRRANSAVVGRVPISPLPQVFIVCLSPSPATGLEPLGHIRLGFASEIKRSRHAGSRFRGGRCRPVRGLRPLRRAAEARVTMLVVVLYVAGAVVVTVYMLAALLRPDKF